MSAKVEAFRTQKEVIKAQYSAAEAQVRIGEATTGLSSEMSDVGAAIARAQDKTEALKARASAVEELVATGALDDLTAPGSSDLDRQIAALTADTQVESEMARLKAEVEAPAGPAGELSSGGSESDGAAPESAPASEQPEQR